jgi:hypothetical protein
MVCGCGYGMKAISLQAYISVEYNEFLEKKSQFAE